MVDYTSFFLNSTSDVDELETFELSHPNFTKIYRVVRNATNGITVTLETAAVVTFDYYPVEVMPTSSSNDLDQKMQITFGDLGEILPTELDAVETADTFQIKPTLKYRLYRTDDLSAPMLGPLVLEVQSFSFKRQGCTFIATAPSLNLSKTGETYSVDKFPMLRGFL